ncbi:MAG TPA: hypothetical protein DEO57_05345 [Phycisphaerales bacterium]|nr:hypothetical protein [Phycisphaerales bacterium]
MINVALVGLRASGKSTIAALLAPALDLVPVDTDDLVAARFQEASVADIWRVHGEAAWRECEGQVAGSVLADLGQVISMGGGMPIIPEVSVEMRREQQADRLMVVYLDVAVGVLESRLGSGPGDRPALLGASPVVEVEAVHRDRDPVYRSLADVICVVSDDEPAQYTCDRLLAMLIN